jgi:hypothetical protein
LEVEKSDDSSESPDKFKFKTPEISNNSREDEMAKQDEGLDVSFGDTSSKKNKE